jgi:hypothetical protein
MTVAEVRDSCSKPTRATVNASTKQGTRLLKVMCPNPACAVVVRMTAKYINCGRIPTCSCGTKMEPRIAATRGKV